MECSKGFGSKLTKVKPEERFHFLRNGYICDNDSTENNLIFNRTVGLKSSFKV